MMYIFIILIIVVVISFIKWPRKDVNYHNANATWHILLTMKCYDETPASIHKYLPIVTLGEERDKYIPWGAAVSDKEGNYYYTSYSPIGFVLPYIFIKLFHLDYVELSLYIFNTVLLFLSSVIIFCLFEEVYKKELNYNLLLLLITMYVITPEIMHSMGMVYWHQSLMQVFLPLQILFYYKFIQKYNKKYLILFLIMCIINPYTEWTGYVANGGFIISEILRNRKNVHKKYTITFYIAILTICSLMLFVLHYLSVLELRPFLSILKNRFFGRGFKNKISIIHLFYGYIVSFASSLIIIIVYLCHNIHIKNKIKLDKNIKLLIFVSLFPIIENIIMKQHAIEYTYDRMKLYLPLMIIIYELLRQTKSKRILSAYIFIAIISIGFSFTYRLSSQYIWEIDYKKGNEKIASYINENFDDSVIGCNKTVRGDLNLLINRSCYELVNDYSELEPYALKNKCKYIVILRTVPAGDRNEWTLYKFNAEIYDRETGNIFYIKNKGNDIEFEYK